MLGSYSFVITRRDGGLWRVPTDPEPVVKWKSSRPEWRREHVSSTIQLPRELQGDHQTITGARARHLGPLSTLSAVSPAVCRQLVLLHPDKSDTVPRLAQGRLHVQKSLRKLGSIFADFHLLVKLQL